jgi:hypothetical protein
MGYGGKQTPHGFRASFETLAKSQGIALEFADFEAISALF